MRTSCFGISLMVLMFAAGCDLPKPAPSDSKPAPAKPPAAEQGEKMVEEKAAVGMGEKGRGYGGGLITTRPFRSPHHTISHIALVGGGTVPKPGEVSLAHHGVLFLDEMPEFPRQVLETLRQPLEDGQVTVARASMTCAFPARFMLCGSMEPYPISIHRLPWTYVK